MWGVDDFRSLLFIAFANRHLPVKKESVSYKSILSDVTTMTQFSRTDVAGISLPRMLIGTNWVLVYSHTSPAADEMIRHRHGDPSNIANLRMLICSTA